MPVDQARSGGALSAELAAREPDSFTAGEVQAMFAAAIRAYGYLHESGDSSAALPRGHELAPTDVVRAASGLLAAARLEPFELALWHSFGALPPGTPDHHLGGGG
jgi:hypothetical protein